MSRSHALGLCAAMFITSSALAAGWECKPGSFGTGGSALRIEERKVTESFHGVSVRGSMCVEYVQGPQVSIRLEGEPEMLSQVETVVEKGALVIGEKRGFSWPRAWNNKPLRAIVTAPSLDSLAVAGSGDLVAAKWAGDTLRTAVAGSGDIRVEGMEAKAVSAAISGSGDIRLAGKTDSVKASVAGSGDIDTSRLAANDVSVKIAGSGDAKVWAQKELVASIAGSGDVGYYGDAQVKRKVAGNGSVKRLGDRPN